MKYESVYVAGNGTWLPRPLPVGDAVAQGLCRAQDVARTDFLSATVSTGEPAVEMAARAARQALERSGLPPSAVDLLLYANVYYQGHDMWAPASYVQRAALGNRCPALEIRQMSNGGMAALELAATRLTASRGPSAVLTVAADRFCPPGIDRWFSDPGSVFGDGGSALVLSSEDGYARLRSLVTVANPHLEAMHRGDDPFGPAPFSVRSPLDVKACQKSYLATASMSETVARSAAGQREALEGALADAGTGLADIDWFVLPHFGRRRLVANYTTPLGIGLDRTTWSWFRGVGHLGAGDQFASLGRLVDTGAAGPGDRCLLMGVGAGFTWSSAVVEILRRPAWAGPDAAPAGTGPHAPTPHRVP
ncbi:ketoacyl-ACP synthase III family protein [Streptomyces sp. TG1A-8]|uniref:ketoacyl-ACP synthase III family protein n=1 Tax=Streptomyces sp. TG1A-8 TaxID=3051385 RepID=UPI00265C6920|nr:ketoacyl-ACP synthase III family protein [Streptomyces sp. TG1A-8]MDO0926686.1 ketoacyl-ACP synthase III family protein [Streptomyces sp. TG1A-8]